MNSMPNCRLTTAKVESTLVESLQYVFPFRTLACQTLVVYITRTHNIIPMPEKRFP